MERTPLTYVFDAYCGWCHAFAGALHGFAADKAERIDLSVISGGLFTGDRVGPIGAYPHIPTANARIADLTGARFGAGYQRVLQEGTLRMDSTDAARGLAALRGHVPSLDAARAMQRAWYEDGSSLSDPATYRRIAERLGLDGDAVVSAFSDPASLAKAEADFRRSRELGVDSYPTLLAHTPSGTHRLGAPTSSADTLTRPLDAVI